MTSKKELYETLKAPPKFVNNNTVIAIKRSTFAKLPYYNERVVQYTIIWNETDSHWMSR